MLKELIVKLFIFLLFIVFSCNIKTPEIVQIEHKINYYFEKNKMPSSSFSFILNLENSNKVKKIIIENTKTLDFIVIQADKANIYYDDNKSYLVLNNLKFDLESHYLGNLYLTLYLVDKGYRVFQRSLTILDYINNSELIKLRNAFYSNNNFNYFKSIANNNIWLLSYKEDGNIFYNEIINNIEELKAFDYKKYDSYIYLNFKGFNLFYKLD